MAESSRREKDLDLVEDFNTVRAITEDGRSVQVPKSKFGGNLEVASDNVLGGIKASPKSETDTNEVKIDPNTGKLYCPPSEVAMATAERIGGIVADVKTSEETEEVKIDPNTGKAYVKPSFSPDEEDITITGGTKPTLKFKDRKYSPGSANGLGCIILRKNFVGAVNVLTQDMISQPNTIYEIRYDFDLNGAEITVPENCVLDFQGGSFRNGTIIGKETSVVSGLNKIFYSDISLEGIWKSDCVFSEWVGAIGDGISDDTRALQLLTKFKGNIVLQQNRIYLVSDFLIINGDSCWNLNGSDIRLNGNVDISIFYIKNASNVKIQHGSITGYEVVSEQNLEYGVTVDASQNVVLDDLRISGFSRDGIYIGYEWSDSSEESNLTNNILVNRCVTDGVGRNGITLCSGDNVTINQCVFKNINAIAPAAGIDIEPENVSTTKQLHLNNIRILDCTFDSCFNSIHVYGWLFNYEISYITADNLTCINGGRISIADGKDGGAIGTRFTNITFKNPTSRCVKIINPKTTASHVFKNVCILDPQLKNGISPIFEIRTNKAGLENMGGVDVENLVLMDSMDDEFKYLRVIDCTTLNSSDVPVNTYSPLRNIKVSGIVAGVPTMRTDSDFKDIDPVDRSSLVMDNTVVMESSFNDGIGWYKIAKLTGSDMATISLFRHYSSLPSECMELQVEYTENSLSVSSNRYWGSGIITAVRMFNDGSDNWLEIYYNSEKSNKCSYKITTIRGNVVLSKLRKENSSDYIFIKSVGLKKTGTTSGRPIVEYGNIGFVYFDKTINKPIWWTGSKWVDAIGTEV